MEWNDRESAAIILYLVDNYDRSHRLSFARYEEKILNIQWLFFQASGQGCVVSSFSLCFPFAPA